MKSSELIIPHCKEELISGRQCGKRAEHIFLFFNKCHTRSIFLATEGVEIISMPGAAIRLFSCLISSAEYISLSKVYFHKRNRSVAIIYSGHHI